MSRGNAALPSGRPAARRAAEGIARRFDVTWMQVDSSYDPENKGAPIITPMDELMKQG